MLLWHIRICRKTLDNQFKPSTQGVNEGESGLSQILCETENLAWTRRYSNQCTKFHQNPSSRFSVQARTKFGQSQIQHPFKIWLWAGNSPRQIIMSKTCKSLGSENMAPDRFSYKKQKEKAVIVVDVLIRFNEARNRLFFTIMSCSEVIILELTQTWQYMPIN